VAQVNGAALATPQQPLWAAHILQIPNGKGVMMKMRSITGIGFWVLGVAVLAGTPARAEDAPYFAASDEVTGYVVRNDWQGLSVILGPKLQDAEMCRADGDLRLLAGHMYMAMGQNTRAVTCFYCEGDSLGSATLRSWTSWTDNLLAVNPDSAASNYLHGDALARAGDLIGAVGAFDKTLALDSGFYLARNARGVARWILFAQQPEVSAFEDSARSDFVTVTNTQPGFADGWANRGIVDLLGQNSVERVRAHFEMAMRDDETFYLAKNGLAMALGAGGDAAACKRMLEETYRAAPATPFVAFNLKEGNVAAARQRGARGGLESLSFGFDVGAIKIGGFKLTDRIAANFSIDFNPRGGVYMALTEGDNLKISKDANPQVVGTWFSLNYPSGTK